VKNELPLLEMDVDECPLARMTFALDGLAANSHAALVAVRGRAFCMTLSVRLDHIDAPVNFAVVKTVDAGRSHIRAS
jgi:hypothetical protein